MGFSFAPSALTRPGTATASSLRLRLLFKAARAGGVTKGKKFKATTLESPQKQKLYFLKNECFWFFRFG